MNATVKRMPHNLISWVQSRSRWFFLCGSWALHVAGVTFLRWVVWCFLMADGLATRSSETHLQLMKKYVYSWHSIRIRKLNSNCIQFVRPFLHQAMAEASASMWGSFARLTFLRFATIGQRFSQAKVCHQTKTSDCVYHVQLADLFAKNPRWISKIWSDSSRTSVISRRRMLAKLLSLVSVRSKLEDMLGIWFRSLVTFSHVFLSFHVCDRVLSFI